VEKEAVSSQMSSARSIAEQGSSTMPDW